ncbi:hypothetical protein F4779DRAFT_84959 [Xylariaceae sp. FL0662B]|nr:hypothetical protein F4779DRAFT_84959 [Xylariaceae sp. FL0662B]
MPSLSLLAQAFFAAQVFANPIGSGPMGPDGCPKTTKFDGYEEPYVADLGFYSDKDCTKEIQYDCVYARQKWIDGGKGAYECSNSKLPKHTPFYAKVRDTPFPNLQLLFTLDQSCPPSGAGAVFASLIDNSACVEMNLGGNAPGISVYPHGGAPISVKEKRDKDSCKNFKIHSQEPSQSQPVKISDEVDCTNGSPSGCTITKGEQHTKSVTTSYSTTAGVTLKEVFSVSATFGQEYTDESTTEIQYSETVQQGQKGYLTAYSSATLFHGDFTECDSGKNHAGQALVIQKDTVHYLVVNTGS